MERFITSQLTLILTFFFFSLGDPLTTLILIDYFWTPFLRRAKDEFIISSPAQIIDTLYNTIFKITI